MMDTMREEIADSLGRTLAEVSACDQVRRIEAGGEHQSMWSALEASGFLDALVPEDRGGAGLSLYDAGAILELSGSHAVPAPLAETVVLRGLLAASGIDRPSGSIAFGGVARGSEAGYVCRGVIEGARADHVLLQADGQWRLASVEDGVVERPALESTLVFSSLHRAIPVPVAHDPVLAEALVRAVQMAGAMGTVLDRTLAYANDRQQFGRAIGKFQAIQHQLAVMAEQVFSSRMAAQVATHAPGLVLDPLRIAIAKARAGEAAAEVAALSHAIHGAIGFTEEFDLQLLTRRLYVWRRAAGGDAYWHQRIGALTVGHRGPALDVLRRATDVAA